MIEHIFACLDSNWTRRAKREWPNLERFSGRQSKKVFTLTTKPTSPSPLPKIHILKIDPTPARFVYFLFKHRFYRKKLYASAGFELAKPEQKGSTLTTGPPQSRLKKCIPKTFFVRRTNRLKNDFVTDYFSHLLLSVGQCDQIWRNFATLAQHQKTLAILKVFI